MSSVAGAIPKPVDQAISEHEAEVSGVHGITAAAATVLDDATVAAMLTTLGGLGGALGATDNALVRADGTGGKTGQGSTSTLSDAGILSLNGTLNLNPANGGVTIDQGFGIWIRTANSLMLQSGLSDAVSIRRDGVGSYGRLLFIDLVSSIAAGLFANSGNLEINNGTAGQYRDLILRNLTVSSGVISLGIFTVATLPTPTADGQVAFASNGRKAGEGAGAGTGVKVVSDGGTWYADIYNSVAVAA